MQVDSQARTQQLKGLAPGARYEVTVVSVRGFEESEPLTGFLTTGEAMGGSYFSDWRGQGRWRVQPQTRGPAGLGKEGWGKQQGPALSLYVVPPVPDGPTQLRALNLTEGTAVLHWKPPQAPVDTYDIRVTAPGSE